LLGVGMPATSLKLHVGCDIVVRAGADCPIVAMLRPASGLAQWLSSETYAFDPWVPTTEYVDTFGNLCQRLVVPQGDMRLRVEATVETEPDLAVAPQAPFTLIQALPDYALQYLLPSRYCPSDKLEARARDVVGSRLARLRAGRGDPRLDPDEPRLPLRHERRVDRCGRDARRRRRGVPRLRPRRHRADARDANPGADGRRLPARLEPMDLHAWFEAYVGDRWYTFDATQATPRGGRVVLAYGRDAADVAFISNYGPLQTVAMKVWVDVAPPPGRCRRRRRRSRRRA
jgi:hypothetical protein